MEMTVDEEKWDGQDERIKQIEQIEQDKQGEGDTGMKGKFVHASSSC